MLFGGNEGARTLTPKNGLLKSARLPFRHAPMAVLLVPSERLELSKTSPFEGDDFTNLPTRASTRQYRSWRRGIFPAPLNNYFTNNVKDNDSYEHWP